ncbi:MAG: dehydrogenase subunit [Gemmatimonadetes bacterium]|nr:dehydrogenase subunit [Gemmatimonadota bacterium]
MDLKLLDAEPTLEEREAVDAAIGAPTSAWDGGERGTHRDAHTALGGASVRNRRHELVPALQSLQARVGWISEGGLGYVCERLGVPPADAWGVATFYALLATTPRPRRVLHVCSDIACARKAHGVELALEASVGPPISGAPSGDSIILGDDEAAWMHSPCLGMCDMAPAALLTVAGETPVERLCGNITPDRASGLLARRRVRSTSADILYVEQRLATTTPYATVPDSSASAPIPQLGDPSLVLLKRVGVVDPTSLESYRAAGGFEALQRALEMGAEAVVAEVSASKLVGRGGAAFPTGRKWEAVRTQPAQPHYLVCNADESEPGTFKDRLLMTHDPFAIVESMTIASFAAGCSRAYLYVRAEYPLAYERIANAIARCRDAGVFPSGFDIELRRGAGAYICGEETALFESIEGKRGEPRSKPPFPVNSGLFGKPTVVNNVETLANVIPILLMGGTEYAKIGTAGSTGTRLFCLSGAVRKPGVYEVPCGTSLRSLLELAEVREMSALLLGGAAGNFLRPDEIDVELSMEGARAANATLGSGVVLAFDEQTDLHHVVRRIAGFFRDESCGQCVPCRVGTVRQEESLHRLAHGRPIGGVAGELALLEEVGVAMRDASICGLGQTAYAAVESAIKRLRLYEGMA